VAATQIPDVRATKFTLNLFMMADSDSLFWSDGSFQLAICRDLSRWTRSRRSTLLPVFSTGLHEYIRSSLILKQLSSIHQLLPTGPQRQCSESFSQSKQILGHPAMHTWITNLDPLIGGHFLVF
jgi:hypothetical protein